MAGEQALMSCYTGYIEAYEATRFYKEITCTSSTKWSSFTSLNCKRLECKSPTVPDHAEFTGRCFQLVLKL